MCRGLGPSLPQLQAPSKPKASSRVLTLRCSRYFSNRCGARTLARKDGKSMKGLIAPSLLPIRPGGSSKQFTIWLFLREALLVSLWEQSVRGWVAAWGGPGRQPLPKKSMPLEAVSCGKSAVITMVYQQKQQTLLPHQAFSAFIHD